MFDSKPMCANTIVGWGEYKCTNGFDTLTAKYSRGPKTDGKYHPHWDLINSDGELVERVFAGKDEALSTAEKLLCRTPKKLTDEEASEMQAHKGSVTGIVKLSLAELIHCDGEGFLDLLNERLCDGLLHGYSYNIVGHDKKHVFLRVNALMDEY